MIPATVWLYPPQTFILGAIEGLKSLPRNSSRWEAIPDGKLPMDHWVLEMVQEVYQPTPERLAAIDWDINDSTCEKWAAKPPTSGSWATAMASANGAVIRHKATGVTVSCFESTIFCRNLRAARKEMVVALQEFRDMTETWFSEEEA